MPLFAMAQSSMTDSEIIQFVMEENAAGTSQAQIVTKLVQRGVTIDQIRRLRERYAGASASASMTGTDVSGMGMSVNRMRVNNAVEGSSAETGLGTSIPSAAFMMPDSLYFESLMSAMADKKRVFGRDIFNNKYLTFEPDMNIATPQNYRLGPGDAVFIDIYGASQKTIEDTVSPDGTVTIEGYGPVSISGLTVEEANAKLRSTVGSRYRSSKISLTVGQTRTIMINVMGEVKNPGTYTLPAFASVFHALYMAGGTNDIGTLRNIKVYRKRMTVL